MGNWGWEVYRHWNFTSFQHMGIRLLEDGFKLKHVASASINNKRNL
jgi:hypothetical protein